MNIKYPSISENHQKELLGSAISPEIISLNFLSVESDEVYNLLFYSPGLERTNTGGLTTGVIKQYAHLEYGAGGVLAWMPLPSKIQCGDVLNLIFPARVPKRKSLNMNILATRQQRYFA